MQGYMYVNNKKARPNQVLRLTSEMDRAVYAVAFRVGTELPEKLSVAFDSERGYHVELGDQVLALKRDGQKVRFEPVARVEPGAEKEASKPVDAAGEKLEATGKEATQPSAPEGSAAPATSAR
jgi:hypothetical protein